MAATSVKIDFSLKTKNQLELKSGVPKMHFAFIKILLTSVEKITDQLIQEARLRLSGR